MHLYLGLLFVLPGIGTHSWNVPPEITSTPPTQAIVGRKYFYPITVLDPDPRDKIELQLVTGPASALLVDGALTWLPQAQDEGDRRFVLLARDAQGATDTQEFTVRVTRNHPPVIAAPGDLDIELGSELLFVVQVEDQDGDETKITASSLPDGANFDQQSAKFHFVPRQGQVNHVFDVTFVATDGDMTSSATVHIRVLGAREPDPVPPETGLGTRPDGSRPRVTINPKNGAFVNSSRPDIVIEFAGALFDPSTTVVLLDGDDVTPSFQVVGRAAVGRVGPVSDGSHSIQVSVATVAGKSGKTLESRSSFVVSTENSGGPTTVFGFLLDPEGDVPIVGARVYFEEGGPQDKRTDNTGRYEIVDAPFGGEFHLIFDPRDAILPPEATYSYPVYRRPVTPAPGAITNAALCFLPKVYPVVTFAELEQDGIFSCSQGVFLQDYLLENPNEPVLTGVKLHIRQGTYVRFINDEDPCGQFLTIEPVNKRKAPSNLPPGSDPSLLITVQPTGMEFRSASNGSVVSLPITFPNKRMPDGTFEYAEGNLLDLFSVNHETGEFQRMGTMQVQGAELVTIDGGLQGGSWHCACPPQIPPDDDLCANSCCETGPMEEFGPEVEQATGFIREVFLLPERRLFDESFQLSLNYNSEPLVGNHILRMQANIPVQSTIPAFIFARGFWNNIAIGGGQWFCGNALNESDDNLIDVPVFLNTAALPQGIQDIRVDMTNIFGATLEAAGVGTLRNSPCGGNILSFLSSVGTSAKRHVKIWRPTSDVFGRGWSLSGDDRIIETNGRLMLVQGSGRALSFSDALLVAEKGLRLVPVHGSSSMSFGIGMPRSVAA